MLHLFASSLNHVATRVLEAVRPLKSASAGFLMGARRIHGKALLACALSGLVVSSQAATPPSTPITNTASASYNIAGSPATPVNGSVTITTDALTPSKTEFLQYVPAGSPLGGTPTAISPTACSTSGSAAGPFVPSSGPTPIGAGSPLPIPGTYNLAPTTSYTIGEPVFVRVTDYNRNLNPLLAETIVMTVTSNTGDSETLQLTETGPSTGVFVGYIQSAGGAPASNNCQLSVAAGNTLTAHYTDTADNTDTSTSNVLIDPFGILFDSATGAPVNGAQVTLINVATGLPAQIFGADGISTYPSTVTSGGSATDSSGHVYTFPAGGYEFPRMAPGNYRLAISAPGYAFPSVVPTAALPQKSPGVPYTIVTGSRGEAFPLNPGPAIQIDVPLDASSGGVQITKSAGKAVVSIGDFVPYTLSIRNNGASAIGALQIADRLPAGFRYRKGSVRLNTVVGVDPVVSADGRGLVFSLGSVAGAATVNLQYVAEVVAGARPGSAENIASATGGVTSNTARASVIVTEDLMRNRAILVGRVIIGSCDDKVENDQFGLKNARIVLENGTYILTDKDGRWHADNIMPGTHVVQLDKDFLPEGYEVMTCEKNTRFAGRNYSQFINVRGGTLWRADFHVQKRAAEQICLDQRVALKADGTATIVDLSVGAPVSVDGTSTTLMLPAGSQLQAGSVMLNGKPYPDAVAQDGMLTLRLPARSGQWQDQFRFALTGVAADGSVKALSRVNASGQPAQSLPLVAATTAAPGQLCAPFKLQEKTPEAPATRANQRELRLVEQLPYDTDWLATAKPGVEWLHPQASFQPAIPAIKAAVKHAPTDTVELRINGKLADALAYDGMAVNADRSVALSTWRGLSIKEGDNVFELTVRDAAGKLVKEEKRTIHYGSAPTRVVFDDKQSRLLADGKTRPVIAVRLLDAEGKPVRRGISGEFQINEPYQPASVAEAIEREPLAGAIGGKARFEVGADGVALIELLPTTQTGEVVLNFAFGGQTQKQEVRAWLAPGKRDWILVGLAEGTTGLKTLSGNMQAITDASADEKIYDGNRIAFYAKGQIKGDYLLTMAYDTAKKTGAAVNNLKQAIDPNAYYTLYADATQPMFDAASASKLYLKIEKSQFYAMFGDYDTGMTVTQLSRYSRTLNGLKSEYKGKQFSYNAFATMTAQAFVRDEIPGNGTSGLYQLSRQNLVVNSDKVRMEVRDRFHSEIVLSSQSFTRYLDYDIDPIKGTLFFHQPIPVRDANFNPVYIVAEYESGSNGDKKLTYGGRVAYKPTEQIEVGATHVHEGNVGNSGSLNGADVTYKPDSKTIVKAEFAATDRSVSGVNASGNAWLVEATRQDANVSAHAYARQQDAGFGLGQQAGSETGTRKIGADARVKISDTMQLQGEAYRQDVLATGAQRNVGEARVVWRHDALTTNAGVRIAQDQDGAGNSLDSKQAVGGVAYEMLDKKVVLKAQAEVGVASGQASTDFPNRLLLGMDYKLTQQSTLFVAQEFAKGASLSANTTRAGIRTVPWSGGELAASLGNQVTQDSGRLFANTGLTQRWQINEKWRADFGLDRSQTLQNSGVAPLNSNVPLASGSPAGGLSPSAGTLGDYTAIFAGASFNDKTWSANSRLEMRRSQTDDRLNVLAGVQRNLDEGRSVAAGFIYTDTSSALTSSTNANLRLSAAYRPWNSPWIWLNRMDLISQSNSDVTGNTRSRKLVNNFNANYKPNIRTQLAFQYGAKYVLDNIGGSDYSGYTDLIGIEARYDLSEDWDIGGSGSMMHSWTGDQRSYAAGVSAGYKLATNTWVGVGYNFLGFTDNDFAGAEYRVKGVYASIRMKFDQDTLGLNKPNGPTLTRP